MERLLYETDDGIEGSKQKEEPGMSGHETQRGWATAVMIALGAAGLVIVAGLAVLFATGGGSDGEGAASGVQNQDTAGQALPEYVMAEGDQVAMAYQFALDRPDVMMWIPCYCGCGGHSGHKNARDCFVKPTSSSGDIQFDDHGSACNVCVDIALRAREMTLAGRPLREIRAAVDQEFSDIGPGTDTPLPPE
jgi:hypothetical protein